MGSDSGDSNAGPLKARAKMSMKRSTENLLDNENKPAAPVRASSMEDIHSLSKQSSTKSSSGGGKIVDAVVKVYQPDHSHKYIDISSVSQYLL